MHIIGQTFFLKEVERFGLELLAFLVPIGVQFVGLFERDGQGIKLQQRQRVRC
jgi:hypothetical protein